MSSYTLTIADRDGHMVIPDRDMAEEMAAHYRNEGFNVTLTATDDIELLGKRVSGHCVFTYRNNILFGRPRIAAQCVTCDVPLGGWTIEDARMNFERHQTIPAPPADILARPLAPADIQAYPAYFIEGRGRAVASSTLCAHDYYLTDSCPGCDADQDTDAN